MFCLLATEVKITWHNGKMKTLAKYLNRDHTSICHAVSEAIARRTHEENFKHAYDQCVELLAMANSEDYIINQLQGKIERLKNEIKRKNRSIRLLNYKLYDRDRRTKKPKQGLPLFG